MQNAALLAALGTVLVAAAVFFFIGRSSGRRAERKAQVAARATAEETSRRILEDASREAETLRKSAVVAGKEETIRLREAWELEANKRREEIQAAERRIQERDTSLDRKLDMVETRDKEIGKRATDLGRREKFIEDRAQELEKLVAEERRRLEQLAGLSAARRRPS